MGPREGSILRADVDPGLGEGLQGPPAVDMWPRTGYRDLGRYVWVSPGSDWGRVGGTEPLLFLGSQTQTSGGEDGFPDMALASCPALAVPYPQPLTNIPRGLERRMAGLRRCRVSVDVR